ncbi:MAG: hypothetical protein HYV42_01025 [Candidatus Magasanikbacteria bacterium]|nr:hypothetical protein [Candidatus Magasanikbacteria bacterium]
MAAERIHFIGICGVAMSALALAFKRQEWRVTGSDVGFYPPVSTHLKEAGIDFYPGWHPDKMIADGVPDLVVVGNVASSNNPEWRYVQEHQIPYRSYPQIVAERLVKKNSIVCAGTFGKTTSTAFLSWILQCADYRPSYLFGGISLNTAALPSACLAESEWSVVEGDEYKSARWDERPKFAHYSPTHLLLTSVVWDHADLYPTADAYRAAFQQLVAAIPPAGVRVISEKALPLIKEPAAGQNIITYGAALTNDYLYTNVVQSPAGVEFDIVQGAEKFTLSTACLGEYMADNLTGCFALARSLGIDPKKITKAIASFPGLKRRLEKRYQGTITIFDDIAHSPSKAQAVLESLRAIYAGKIIAVFEPNTGNRRPEAARGYDGAFAGADEVIIPRLTHLKIDPTELEPPFAGDELARIIGATHPPVHYLPDDEQLIEYLKQKTQPDDVVVFMGSHGFRGMIEELIKKIGA